MRIYNIQNRCSYMNFLAKGDNKKSKTPSPKYGYGTQSDLALIVDQRLKLNPGDSSYEGYDILYIGKMPQTTSSTEENGFFDKANDTTVSKTRNE